LGIGKTVEYSLKFPGEAPKIGNSISDFREKLQSLRNWCIDNLPYSLPNSQTINMELSILRNEDVILAEVQVYKDLLDSVKIVDDCYLIEQFSKPIHIIFEGAQGVLLDEKFGDPIHNTWSNCTFDNAFSLLQSQCNNINRVGVLRTYEHRHGAGPLVTYDSEMDLPEPHNPINAYQGEFRIGHFDGDALKKAIGYIGGVDELAITHLDRVKWPAKIVGSNPELYYTEVEFLSEVERIANARVGIKSYTPTANGKIFNGYSTNNYSI
jgi:adenylosuccinate synthase